MNLKPAFDQSCKNKECFDSNNPSDCSRKKPHPLHKNHVKKFFQNVRLNESRRNSNLTENDFHWSRPKRKTERDIFQFLGLFFPETFVQKPLISIINVRKGSVNAETQSEPFSPTSQTQTTSFRSTFVDLQMSFFF